MWQRDASEAKEEAAKARAYLQHANDSAEIDAHEVSALDRELKSVRVAREQTRQTVSDAQRAFVRGGDKEKSEAGSTMARKQAAAAKRDVAAQESNRSRMTQGEDSKGNSRIHISQESLQGLRSLVRKLESGRRSVMSDRRRENVYQRAYRDAFHEALKAVFGSQSKSPTYRISSAVLPDGSVQPVHDTDSNGEKKVVHDSYNVRRAQARSRAQVISGDGTKMTFRSGQVLAKR